MSDREMLELAAKAAGYTVRWHSESHYGPTMEIMEGDEGGPPWNPLTDDGDALRLAVKLHISVLSNIIRVEASTIQLTLARCFIHEDSMRQDDLVATRRAIVRAAAEIGRAVP